MCTVNISHFPLNYCLRDISLNVLFIQVMVLSHSINSNERILKSYVRASYLWKSFRDCIICKSLCIYSNVVWIMCLHTCIGYISSKQCIVYVLLGNFVAHIWHLPNIKGVEKQYQIWKKMLILWMLTLCIDCCPPKKLLWTF